VSSLTVIAAEAALCKSSTVSSFTFSPTANIICAYFVRNSKLFTPTTFWSFLVASLSFGCDTERVLTKKRMEVVRSVFLLAWM
jgi:hypothetical protein